MCMCDMSSRIIYTYPYRSLLSRIGDNDGKQLKLVFDSIDKDKDGELSLKELEEFALELGSVSLALIHYRVVELNFRMSHFVCPISGTPILLLSLVR